MKAIDLYAAHALGALIAKDLALNLTTADRREWTVNLARDLAVALAKAVCETEPCDVTHSEDVHGNPYVSECARCGEAGFFR